MSSAEEIGVRHFLSRQRLSELGLLGLSVKYRTQKRNFFVKFSRAIIIAVNCQHPKTLAFVNRGIFGQRPSARSWSGLQKKKYFTYLAISWHDCGSPKGKFQKFKFKESFSVSFSVYLTVFCMIFLQFRIRLTRNSPFFSFNLTLLVWAQIF